MDMCHTKHLRLIGLSNYQSWLLFIMRYSALELMWGKGGSGIQFWQPTSSYLRGVINHSREVIDRIALHKLQPKRGVKKTEGNKVWFDGESEPVEADLIIFATGYNTTFPFLCNKKSGTTSLSPHPLCFFSLLPISTLNNVNWNGKVK